MAHKRIHTKVLIKKAAISTKETIRNGSLIGSIVLRGLKSRRDLLRLFKPKF